MKLSYLFVGLGGAIGAIFRVLLSSFLSSFFYRLPLKILIVNILGCFILGVLTEVMALFWSPSENMKHFLVQGLLGGFTTFSAFALEFSLLYEKGFNFTALLYAFLSVSLSIVFFFIGLKLIRLFGV